MLATWHHWRADIRWSFTDGSVKIWHDGTPVQELTHVKTIFPDPHSTSRPGHSYLTVGLYRAALEAGTGPWVVWHDEFKRLEQGNAPQLPHDTLGKLLNCLTATQSPSIN